MEDMKIINLDKNFVIDNFEQLKEVKKGCKIEENYPWTLENFLMEINNKWKYSLAYLSENNEITGFIIASEKIEGIIHIHSFYTKEKYRGTGIGSRLFEALSKKARENNINNMSIWAYEKTPAFVFYKKLGFVETENRIRDNKLEDFNVYMIVKKKI